MNIKICNDNLSIFNLDKFFYYLCSLKLGQQIHFLMRQVIYTDAKSGKKFLKIKNAASPNEKVTENEIYENFFIHLTDDVIIVCLTTAFP